MYLTPEDAYKEIVEILNVLEEMKEEPFRGVSTFGSSWYGYQGKSGSVRREGDGWVYEPASEFPKGGKQ